MNCKLHYRILYYLLALTMNMTAINTAAAASTTEIDIKVNAALKQFTGNVSAGSEFLKRAVGVLVFPSVIKAGFGIGGDINTTDIKDPIVGFVFNNKGLMYNLTLEGAKFTKLVK